MGYIKAEKKQNTREELFEMIKQGALKGA